MRRNGRDPYRDYDFEFGDDMSVTASHCSRFTRRNDLDMFNMTDYQSCENCRHMTPDHRCIIREKG